MYLIMMLRNGGKMRRKLWLLSIIAVMFAASCFGLWQFLGKKHDLQRPFVDLTDEQVISVEAHFGNPEVFLPYSLSREEISELVKSLREIILYHETDYKEYTCPQTLMFEIRTSDGACFCVGACGQIFIINEVEYETDSRLTSPVDDLYLDCVVKIRNSSGIEFGSDPAFLEGREDPPLDTGAKR